jgi:ABC-type long-subunit fatty acid transport system fused permease/ATPase subunit
MLNLFKKDKKEDYQSVSNVVKAHYEDFLANINNGMNGEIKRAGVSFPENLYEFLRIFSKYEQITVSKLVIDMLLYVLKDRERFNEFLKEKYGKKL